MPGELFHKKSLEATCATSMMVAVALGALLFMSALLVICQKRIFSDRISNNAILFLFMFAIFHLSKYNKDYELFFANLKQK